MNSFESFFANELLKRIETERTLRRAELEKRVVHEEYLFRVGFLQALSWVLDECHDVEKKLKSPM